MLFKKKSLFYLIGVAIILCNIYLIVLTDKQSVKIKELYAYELQLKQIQTELQAIGKSVHIPVNLYSGSTQKRLKASNYRLVCFYSMESCGGCLAEETEVWKKLSKEDRSIVVSAVCIDTAKWNVDMYRAQYEPNFDIVKMTNGIQMDFDVKKTPYVVVTNSIACP